MVARQTYTLSDNKEISFTDNGHPPNSDDYTTLVFVHGSCNASSLEKLYDFSHQLNLRIVLLERPPYGSTPYTESELDDLKQGRKIYLDRFGARLAEFLVQFIQKEKIPKASDDLNRGGITVVGWSAGAALAMTLLSDAKIVPPVTYPILEQYVKDVLLLDPPHVCFGFETPADFKAYNAWTDPDLKDPQEKLHQFFAWASSYFDHSDPAGNLQDMDLTTKQSSDATVTKWSAEESKRHFNERASFSELPMFMEPMQSTLRTMTEQVFYDENLIKTYFPNLRITVIHCTRSCWHCTWAKNELKRVYDERLSKGVKGRPLRFCEIAGANHFVPCEDPKLLLEKVAEGIRK
ncbi:hypothetical protein E1B28_006799 [Marasmius oreades]|uniref:AB hydrolase-1 domain-containing protein n=1 Tax=Marasmius oreades TaxID=181124 RepID=A0A9P7UWY6_9AGAR|nr:uncharacterized protein E1B28_006799 [Marasmius oreades]KAG7096125.1 hypothetical protein E1B28_006799 [Marasmius oreades]